MKKEESGGKPHSIHSLYFHPNPVDINEDYYNQDRECRQAEVRKICLCGRCQCRDKKVTWKDVLPSGLKEVFTICCHTGM